MRAALGTVTVRSTVGSTVRTLEVLTESPDTFFWRVPYKLLHVDTYMNMYMFNIIAHTNIHVCRRTYTQGGTMGVWLLQLWPYV